MRQRAWFPEVVGDDARAPLTATLGRYPGPVWSMAAWFMLGGALLAFTLVAAQGTPTGTATRAGLLLYIVVVLVFFAVAGARTPRWFLRVQLLVSLGAATGLVILAQQDLGVALILWSYLGIAVYAGFWETRVWLLLVLGLVMVLSLGALVAHGLSALMATQWLISMSACVSLGLILNVLLRQFQRESLVDPLTGLLNRRGLQVVLDRGRRTLRDRDPVTLAVVDLDGFKSVNDELGHEEGDRVLARIGETLRGGLRRDDVAVRSGGDEFLLILPRTGIDEARAVVARILGDSPIPWSVGLADWSDDRDFDAALAAADAAMYEDKRQRRER